ncbi:hypothetical protein BKA70DRAFT_1578318 [Coprinopsis sp. MPI-PUGE-AT-0042]|nr:hypothetical protein BKA70DRAFT_1578318 [Coprinopsis sp. MPI-PUGE-AT-0042]
MKDRQQAVCSSPLIASFLPSITSQCQSRKKSVAPSLFPPPRYVQSLSSPLYRYITLFEGQAHPCRWWAFTCGCQGCPCCRCW